MQVFHTAQLGDERTVNEGILAGSIHAGVGAGAWAGFVPAYNVVELLAETARESAVFERKVFEERSAGAMAEAKKNGMTFLELSDRNKWIEASQPAWYEFGKSTPGAAELIDIIKKSA